MAAKMSLKATELLMKLLGMGMTGVHINSTLDADTAKILASEFGWEVEDLAVSDEAALAEARAGEEDTEQTDADVVVRPPVVTVMGHVDHGKTSLLDKIRKANVAEGEAGGITQHIGAYKVSTDHGTIVFLDTPGHEAFTAMRARGASATDLVVLVVAADDGVMPQTKEAIAHAKAAEVPIIVAVNKIDKPSAEPERVKRELVELGLVPEDWGGDTMFVNVSALTGDGIPELLERISLQAEVMELKANPNLPASGTVLEALLDRGRGAVARILVQDGTLRTGDFVLAGPGFGKVRAMTNEHGKNITEAGPSTPVEILGLAEVPGAGDPIHAVLDPKKAQEIAESRKGKLAKTLIPVDARASLEGIINQLKDADMLDLRVIIKGDVQGSVEAVGSALSRLSTDRVKLSIIHAGVGAITEGDVNLAIASKAHHHRLQRAPGRQGLVARGRERDRDSPLQHHLQRRRRRALRDGGPAPRDARREAERQGRGPPDLQDQGDGHRRLLRHAGQVHARQPVPRHPQRGRDSHRQGGLAPSPQGGREGSPRGHGVRHQRRWIHRAEGKRHPRELRRRGSEAEAVSRQGRAKWRSAMRAA